MNGSAASHGEERLVRVAAGPVTLEGNLSLPEGARGIVLFAHGSGSSRHSSRNRYVARLLNEAKLATLLVDLLTQEEEAVDLRTAHLRFDIGLLAERLVGATDWLTRHPDTRHLRIGYFGASTGAAAALVAAAERPDAVGAVVSRGGRPDLAGPALPLVRAPTLLIVGGNDFQVIELNRAAFEQLRCEKQLVIVPGATHLFEEPGALDEVARLAREWFERHLAPAEPNRGGNGS
jgi:putative phosphoribosyl transferase